ncbi:MAG TPA: helix-turn-helix transcriptional regulator [Xanthobacteraceae bacterium]|jgi:transcriptional regulator with XRE-family HTH domain|nr:helix-turn-helix transcriptional regulator [Xanthobacteraceae bacterium]
MGTKRAGPVDAIVGRRIRTRRLLLGLTQTQLAQQLGVSFQQVQKYENGANRVGAGRLVQIAQVLGVPIEALLEGLNAPTRKTVQADDPLDLLSNGAAVRLAQAFSQISDRHIRNALVSLAEGIAAGQRRSDKTAA